VEYRITPSQKREYIHLEVVGAFTSKTLMKCIVETHTLGMELGIHRYLMDASKARNIDSVLGTYEFAHAEMKHTEGIDPRARVAALVSPGDHSHDFVETVSQNAGMALKLFTDREEALAFLAR